MSKKLEALISKNWDSCIRCPFNYDGLDCRVYKAGYSKEVGETFNPYNESPEWCKITSIECYSQTESASCCPCGGVILADTEKCNTPLCFECYSQVKAVIEKDMSYGG